MFTGWAVLATILIEDWWLAILALVELAFGLIWSRRAMRLLYRLRFWMFVLGAMVVGPFLIGEPDLVVGPFHLSREGLMAGLEMAGRAFTLTLGVGLGLSTLSLSNVVAVFDRLGLRGLGFATGLAVNLLGTLQEMATVTLQTIWLRGGMQRPWTALRLFLVTVVANALRYGDEAANAAAVRAFNPNEGQVTPLPLRRADIWLAAALAVCSGLFLLVHW